MHSMFRDSEFNGDISMWDVSNVKEMDNVFHHSQLEKKPEFKPIFKN